VINESVRLNALLVMLPLAFIRCYYRQFLSPGYPNIRFEVKNRQKEKNDIELVGQTISTIHSCAINRVSTAKYGRDPHIPPNPAERTIMRYVKSSPNTCASNNFPPISLEFSRILNQPRQCSEWAVGSKTPVPSMRLDLYWVPNTSPPDGQR
jgi:hypothetical protein